MDVDMLEESLQLGHMPTSNSRLNEHGFGLKNSLATLSGGNGWRKLWTQREGKNVIYVEGPFGVNMEIIDDEQTLFPDKPFIPSDVSTVIMTKVKKRMLKQYKEEEQKQMICRLFVRGSWSI